MLGLVHKCEEVLLAYEGGVELEVGGGRGGVLELTGEGGDVRT